jgi:hypothetical protein
MKKVFFVAGQLIALAAIWALVSMALFQTMQPPISDQRVATAFFYEATALSRALLYALISLICARALSPNLATATAFLFVLFLDVFHAHHALFGITNSLPYLATTLTYAVMAALIGRAFFCISGSASWGRIDFLAVAATVLIAAALGYLFAYINWRGGVHFGGDDILVSNIGTFLQVSQLLSLCMSVMIGFVAGLLLVSLRLCALVSFSTSLCLLSYLSPTVAVFTLGIWKGIVVLIVTAAVSAASSVLICNRKVRNKKTIGSETIKK